MDVHDSAGFMPASKNPAKSGKIHKNLAISGKNGLIRWPCVGRAGAEPPIAGAWVSRCVHHARRRQYATRPGGRVAVRACVGVTALSAAHKMRWCCGANSYCLRSCASPGLLRWVLLPRLRRAVTPLPGRFRRCGCAPLVPARTQKSCRRRFCRCGRISRWLPAPGRAVHP